jgi:hypothetical protein
MHHVPDYQSSKFLAHYPEGVVDRTHAHIMLDPLNPLLFQQVTTSSPAIDIITYLFKYLPLVI